MIRRARAQRRRSSTPSAYRAVPFTRWGWLWPGWPTTWRPDTGPSSSPRPRRFVPSSAPDRPRCFHRTGPADGFGGGGGGSSIANDAHAHHPDARDPDRHAQGAHHDQPRRHRPGPGPQPRPVTVDNFLQVRERRLLQEHRLPPRDQGLRHPGRGYTRGTNGLVEKTATYPAIALESQNASRTCAAPSPWRAPACPTARLQPVLYQHRRQITPRSTTRAVMAMAMPSSARSRPGLDVVDKIRAVATANDVPVSRRDHPGRQGHPVSSRRSRHLPTLMPDTRPSAVSPSRLAGRRPWPNAVIRGHAGGASARLGNHRHPRRLRRSAAPENYPQGGTLTLTPERVEGLASQGGTPARVHQQGQPVSLPGA